MRRGRASWAVVTEREVTVTSEIEASVALIARSLYTDRRDRVLPAEQVQTAHAALMSLDAARFNGAIERLAPEGLLTRYLVGGRAGSSRMLRQLATRLARDADGGAALGVMRMAEPDGWAALMFGVTLLTAAELRHLVLALGGAELVAAKCVHQLMRASAERRGPAADDIERGAEAMGRVFRLPSPVARLIRELANGLEPIPSHLAPSLAAVGRPGPTPGDRHFLALCEGRGLSELQSHGLLARIKALYG